MTLNKQKGLTIIEVMIVMVIVGVVTVFAVPAYKDYTISTQATQAYKEAQALMVPIDQRILDEQLNCTLADIGSSSTASKFGSLKIECVAAATISMTLDGDVHADIKGKTIIFTRNATNGRWTCATTIAADYRPDRC